MLADFFQLGSLPLDRLSGTHDVRLIILSFIVACFASYVAININGHLRGHHNTFFKTISWIIGGAFAMGIGIWSTHFIAMLAFSIPDMDMHYDLMWTEASMVIAILASGFAFFILKKRVIHIPQLAFGGIVLGLAIASMHYAGMEAMKADMTLRYIPSLFLLSIVIAIVASEAALWLAIKSNQVEMEKQFHLKIISALIMGGAICGMHYTGMAATVFTPFHLSHLTSHLNTINPDILSVIIAGVTFIILGIAFAVSAYQLSLNQQLLELARRSGMAEIARTILHNIGNILNSINVSVDLLSQKVTKSKLSDLVSVRDLLRAHQHDLNSFLVDDPKGSLLPQYIANLAHCWEKERDILLNECKTLVLNIQHVKEIIETQESLSRLPSLEQITTIESVVNEALKIVDFKIQQDGITLHKSYARLKPLLIDKVKLLQILVNLLTNAKESLMDSKKLPKLLDVKIKLAQHTKEKFVIEILDNGLGISPENLDLIFLHGFTTKKTKYGFGLHASILAAREMGGEIKVFSKGLGTGALFRLELPYKLPF
ncbi:MHYT domain-containing protein [Legionella fallonii]|uniref:Sensory box histidine kinase/response regulator n=1 Tax=Legionella fallonii LLAP-10 TaxID=1212491 RepID=A0A098G943_9GAMM|nr:MHYT domain-containing protein [Legionella fallonii]CEG57985.1 Sensory box histidine kinase/response regulator [Legionella fallonii LLAP-10]